MLEIKNMKYLIFLFILFFISCKTTRVEIVNGHVINRTKVIRFTNKPDTIHYIKLWNGKLVTKKEYDSNYEKTIVKINKKLKKQIKN